MFHNQTIYNTYIDSLYIYYKVLQLKHIEGTN